MIYLDQDIIADANDPIHQFMEEGFIRIAIDLDLFNILVNIAKPQTLEELSKATGADGVLLGVTSADPYTSTTY